MLLISACVFSKQIFQRKVTRLTHKSYMHMMTFKTSMKTGYLVSTDAKQVVDKNIL